MAKVYIFLANGFEEIEGLTVVDVLRRGGVEVEMVSITGSLEVETSHGINMKADSVFGASEQYMDGAMVVLPGGLMGTNALMAHAGVVETLKAYAAADKYLAAICAAPSVLGMNNLLVGKEATCYPGFESQLLGAVKKDAGVVVSGKVITGEAMGSSTPFAITLLEILAGGSTAQKVWKSIYFRS